MAPFLLRFTFRFTLHPQQSFTREGGKEGRMGREEKNGNEIKIWSKIAYNLAESLHWHEIPHMGMKILLLQIKQRKSLHHFP